MARSVPPLISGASIADRQGRVTTLFRAVWQVLVDGFAQAPTADTLEKTAQTDALSATAVYTTTAPGWYRISYIARVTVPDGVSSSLTVTVGWTESAQALTLSGTAITGDAVTSVQSGTLFVYADAACDLTIATAYASNTANKMTYSLRATAEWLV